MDLKSILIFFLIVLFLIKINIEEYKTNFQIDKIFVINLDKDLDRLYDINLQLNSKNMKFERFKAINGEKLKRKHEIVQKIFKKNLKKKRYTNNQVACCLSHIFIWKKISDNKHNYKHTLILEDDIIIKKNFDNYLQLIVKELPKKWDFLFLGGNKIKGKYFSKHLITPINKQIKKNHGCFGYIINSNNIDNILNECKNISLHLDKFVQQVLSKKFIIFFSNPQIINHNYNYYSNIFKRYRYKDEKKNNVVSINYL